MKSLIFDEEEHSYHLDGVELPAVSHILEAAGVVDTRFFKPEHAERGKRVHKLTEFLDRGTLDWGTVHGSDMGWIEAYQEFKDQYYGMADYDWIEQRLYHPTFLYAGTLDRLSHIGDLIDLKSGVPAPSHQLQLTAYKDAAEKQGKDVNKIWGLYLKEDGTFKASRDLVEYEPDLDAWYGCLQVYNWKWGHKCL